MPLLERTFPCNVAAHGVTEVLIIPLKAGVFSPDLSESLSSAMASTVTISPKPVTGSREEPLSTTPLYGELHLHTFPRLCWRSSERCKVRVVVDRPRLCWASSVDPNVEGLKNSNTHQLVVKAILSVLTLRPQELWSLKELPFTILVVHATTWKWRSLDSRQLCGFQSPWLETCTQRRLWQGRSGQQLGRFPGKLYFFFWCFRKKLSAQETRNKEK